MNLCVFGKQPKRVETQVAPSPEETADPAEVGAARKQEDETLFGGTPDLRTDRSTTSGGVGAAGSGLKLM